MGETTLAAELLGDAAKHRAARRASEREFRAGRATAALVVAGVMTVAGGLASMEIVARRGGGNVLPRAWVDPALAELHRVAWHAPGVQAAGWSMLAVGLLLLLHALLPGRAGMEPLAADGLYVSAALTKAGLRRTVLDAALAVSGVEEASVRIGRQVTVTARTELSNPGNLADILRTAVEARLGELHPVRRRTVAVRLSWRR
ncbi:DUF6286 domain-containing protein [Actinocorallia longicatena]|uniref:DUF6286 domain-containing protein n=1 Tax=Actinocorallia longicatena TaxID=111803 RepID=A0ABP6QRS0_9ACTN